MRPVKTAAKLRCFGLFGHFLGLGCQESGQKNSVSPSACPPPLSSVALTLTSARFLFEASWGELWTWDVYFPVALASSEFSLAHIQHTWPISNALGTNPLDFTPILTRFSFTGILWAPGPLLRAGLEALRHFPEAVHYTVGDLMFYRCVTLGTRKRLRLEFQLCSTKARRPRPTVDAMEPCDSST